MNTFRLLTAFVGSLVFSLNTLAQNVTLADCDRQLSALVKESDANRFSYQHSIWMKQMESVLRNSTDSCIENTNTHNLKHIKLTNKSDIYYFLHSKDDNLNLHWIIRKKDAVDGIKVRSFVDQCKQTSGKMVDTTYTIVEHNSGTESMPLCGFDVKSNKNKQTILYVPDTDLRLYFEEVAEIRPDSDKNSINAKIQQLISALLNSNDIFANQWNGMPRLTTLYSEQDNLRICTYTIVYNDFSNKTFGYVVSKVGSETTITELNDKTESIRNQERAKCNAKNWYGALYTQLIEHKVGKANYYTLIGFKSNDGLVKTRVIDVLSINGDKITFGAPIFKHDRSTYTRRIFKYSAEANMMLRYEKSKRAIIFDHLAPSDKSFADEPSYYGPDFSYDQYTMSKEGWIFKSDVDLRNPKQ